MGDLERNFSRSEFACKCGCGFDGISEDLVHFLQHVRDAVGFALPINSGCRCKEWNRKQGGEESSAHLTGEAVDILCPSSIQRFAITDAALNTGFNRIGVSSEFIHLDISKTLPQKVMWLYGGKE